MFCPKCGVENLNTSKFCKKCGKPLPDPATIRAAAPTFATRMAGLVGQVLDGKYRIDGRLGSGGMGDVYRATRLLIGDAVAIKVLHPHLARDAQAAERFRREAVAATQLRHRNIVALYDVGVSAAHNVPYILMELADGFSLRQIINQYRVLPLDFVVTVTAQVCAALDEAHRLGIVHRDIKPENIIANQTTSGWLVKVLDFGIAKLSNRNEVGLTQDGTALGTPQYMSPEQCMGEQLDGRSDVYSLGILIYEMLVGTVPFKSPVASAIAVHQVQTPPPPLRSHNQSIAPQIEDVVMSALAKNRHERPPTAQQLSKDLIQAATAAFRADSVTVSATPVAAPDVKREFDAEMISTGSDRSAADEKSADPVTTAPAEPEHLQPSETLEGAPVSGPQTGARSLAPEDDPVPEADAAPDKPKKRRSRNKPASSEVSEPDEEARKEEVVRVLDEVEHVPDELLAGDHTAEPPSEASSSAELPAVTPVPHPDEIPVPDDRIPAAPKSEETVSSGPPEGPPIPRPDEDLVPDDRIPARILSDRTVSETFAEEQPIPRPD